MGHMCPDNGSHMLRSTLALVAVGVIFGVLSLMDYSEALTQEAMEKEARPMRASGAFDHPIPYKAIVCQSGPLEKPRCRFYTGERLK